MTKDTTNTSQLGQSFQHTRPDPTKPQVHLGLGLGVFDLPSRRFLTNDAPTPFTLAPQVTFSYIKGVLPHVIYALNFEIEWKLCRSV